MFRDSRLPFLSYQRFLLVNIDDLLISAVSKGFIRPEVRSPIDNATMVAYECSIHTSCLACAIRLLYAFPTVRNGGMSNSAARGNLDRK
jgi:hypothetical protein